VRLLWGKKKTGTIIQIKTVPKSLREGLRTDVQERLELEGLMSKSREKVLLFREEEVPILMVGNNSLSGQGERRYWKREKKVRARISEGRKDVRGFRHKGKV